jgi:hypothetical protein
MVPRDFSNTEQLSQNSHSGEQGSPITWIFSNFSLGDQLLAIGLYNHFYIILILLEFTIF